MKTTPRPTLGCLWSTSVTASHTACGPHFQVSGPVVIHTTTFPSHPPTSHRRHHCRRHHYRRSGARSAHAQRREDAQRQKTKTPVRWRRTVPDRKGRCVGCQCCSWPRPPSLVLGGRACALGAEGPSGACTRPDGRRKREKLFQWGGSKGVGECARRGGAGGVCVGSGGRPVRAGARTRLNLPRWRRLRLLCFVR